MANDEEMAKLKALFGRSFAAVVLSITDEHNGYTVHVVTGQDDETPEEAYEILAGCGVGLGHLAESVVPTSLLMIAENAETGGHIESAVIEVDGDEEEGATDLASLFRMQPQGNA